MFFKTNHPNCIFLKQISFKQAVCLIANPSKMFMNLEFWILCKIKQQYDGYIHKGILLNSWNICNDLQYHFVRLAFRIIKSVKFSFLEDITIMTRKPIHANHTDSSFHIYRIHTLSIPILYKVPLPSELCLAIMIQ